MRIIYSFISFLSELLNNFKTLSLIVIVFCSLNVFAQSTLTGCTNPAAVNFNPSATDCANDYDCDCEYAFGCMDASACNYDPSAVSQPSGACIYTASSSEMSCVDLSISSTVTSNSNGPTGVAEGNTVTFNTTFDDANWTQISDQDYDYNYGITIGSNTQWWQADVPVSYTITYSGGYSETGQITKVKVIDGGSQAYMDAYEYVNYGIWSSPYWSTENDYIKLYDGNNEIYEIELEDNFNMSCALSIVDVMSEISNSQVPLTMYWANWGEWGTYHYDYTTDANQAEVSFIDCSILGCTNPVAVNYNPSATGCANDYDCDCEYAFGCMDASACNYDPSAVSQPSGACIYTASSSEMSCVDLSISSTVTSNSNGPTGVAEGNTVTFNTTFDDANWTQISDQDYDYNYGITIGSNTQWWQADVPVSYTITYSGGYSETGQITKVKVIDGGSQAYMDAYEYVNYGIWSSPYWSTENDYIKLYDGNNEIYEIELEDNFNMSCALSIVDVMSEISNSQVPLTMYWANWGEWGTYHYDYTTDANQAEVSFIDCSILGCMDETASNYEAAATEDDGSCTYAATMQNLFFSEYAEGSSNNKYLEIYNASDVTVSLADYGYPNVSNAPSTVGEYEYWNSFDEGAEIAPNGVYIVAHGSSDPLILALANETHNYLSNGDDGYALAYGTSDDYVIIDHIGDFNGDPGSGWEVAGVSNATKDHTLVRKCSVESGNMDWVVSAGTDANNSEWIVLEQNDWSDLGMHTDECPTVVLGCTDSTANNFNELATEDDGSCDYTVISYYSLTVSVDMSVEGFVAGDGSTWDGLDGSSMAIRLDGGSWVAMTDMGDNVWSHTFTDLVAGDYAYNFNDGWYESGPFGDCVGGQYGNDRLATIVDMDVTVPTVCWESCEACPEVILGCTDSEASNYDAAATEDDGSCTYPAPMVSLFYSEYAEGSSNNKYFEIYNPSSDAVNLSDYTYNNCSNDCDGWEYSTSFAEGAIIPAGGTYSVCHPSFTGDQSLCDELTTLYFNGNDAQGLVYVPTGEVLDVIGDTVGAAEYWSVAGVSSGTKDHTLVRKCSIEQGNSDWSSSAGTDADDSEWIVLEQNDWSDLGMHTAECPTVVLGCTDSTANNYNEFATEDDDSCEYTIFGCIDSLACNYDSLATESDNSCVYPETDFDCNGNCLFDNLTLTLNDNYGDGWNGGYLTINGVEYTQEDITAGSQQFESEDFLICLDLSVCHDIIYTSGNWSSENSWSISDSSGVIASGGNFSGVIGACGVFGCTDSTALNYDEMAEFNNGTCEYLVDISIDLNYSVTSSTCNHNDDYNASNTPSTTNYISGEDNMYFFSANNGSINISLNQEDQGTAQPAIVVYDGHPEDESTSQIALSTGSSGDNITLLVETNDSTTYYLLVDGMGTWGCFSYDLIITQIIGGCTDQLAFNYNPEATFNDGSCIFLGCTDESAVNYDSNANQDDGSCIILGCTDPTAYNYNPSATFNNGSCTYCNTFEVVVISTSDASAADASDGSVQATGQGGSNDYEVTVVDGNGVPQNSFALAAGDYTVTVTDVTSGCEASTSVTISEPTVAADPCDIVPSGLFVDDIIHNRVVFNWSAPSAAPSHYMIRYREVGTSSWTVMTAGPVNSNEFTGTSRTRYFMEPGTTYEWNIRARVLNEDGSTNCQSAWSASNEYTTLDACANLENLSVSTEAVWATLSADAPAAEWGVWQSKGKMRVVGTNSFRYVNGDENGNISSLKGNFTASTDYEWHTKAWCTGNVDSEGNSDPMYHSGWGDFSSFTTEAPCDKMPTNLSTSANGAQTAITMSWDTPESGEPDHYFLELTNVTTGQVWAWNNISGSDNSKTKFGLTAGDYSWRIRGACGTNGTSWATIFSQPVTYTLGGARLENSSVANLDVYPNPSRDIFNVTFTSEEAQTMTVKVVNMIGEEIFTEELTEFVGQYTQVIDMNTQPKGVYFLEITTSTGGINKKIVLQ